MHHFLRLIGFAALTAADIEQLDASLKLRGRIKRDGWAEQAKALLGR